MLRLALRCALGGPRRPFLSAGFGRRSGQAGNVVVMFCTEVSEVYEAADRAHVVTDGRLSAPIMVHEYSQIEALATDIASLERHARENAESGYARHRGH